MEDWLLNWTAHVSRNLHAEIDGVSYDDGPEWFYKMWDQWKRDSDFGQKMDLPDDNLKIFTQRFETLKGQMVLSHDRVYRFIGLAEDEEDYYYVLYDGREIHLNSCVGNLVELKGQIQDRDYDEMIRMARINHWDQPGLWGNQNPEDLQDWNETHKQDITAWEGRTRFILGPFWDLN